MYVFRIQADGDWFQLNVLSTKGFAAIITLLASSRYSPIVECAARTKNKRLKRGATTTHRVLWTPWERVLII